MTPNYNIITYLIYLPIILFITIKVGWMFYKNGEIFLLSIFEEQNTIKTVNKILLMGYYLINIGYSLAVISFWTKVDSITTMIESLSFVIGAIIIFLAILHYNNIVILKQISKRKLLNT